MSALVEQAQDLVGLDHGGEGEGSSLSRALLFHGASMAAGAFGMTSVGRSRPKRRRRGARRIAGDRFVGSWACTNAARRDQVAVYGKHFEL